jgi:type II secretory pathway component GspD/PulD (secretin)
MKIPFTISTLLWSTFIWAQQPPVPTKPVPVDPEATPASEAELIVMKRGAVMQGIALNTLLDEYSKLVGRTLITGQNLPKVTFDFKLTNDLNHQEAKAFYETLLFTRQIAVLPMGKKFILVIPAGEVVKTPPPFTQKKAAEFPESDAPVLVKVKLQHVMPSELVQALSGLAKSPGAIMGIDHARMLYLRDSALNVKRMLEIIEDTDVIKETHEAVIPVGNASVKEIANHLNQLVSGTPNTAPTSSTSGRTNRSTSSRINTTRNRGPFILSGTSIVACESANSILVVAPTEAKLELAKSLIEKLKSNAKE